MSSALLHGESVTVLRPSIAYDERMDPVTTWTPESVDNVLFGRPSTEDVDGAMRAYGVHAQYVLGIPKSYTASLRGCRVTRERDLLVRVVGNVLYVQPNRLTVSGSEALVAASYAIESGNIQFEDELLPVFAIAGDPQPLPPELCPTPWNREAIAGWVDG